jgi:hypothetical protein
MKKIDEKSQKQHQDPLWFTYKRHRKCEVQNDASEWKNDRKNDSFYYGGRKCEIDTGPGYGWGVLWMP